MNNIFKKEILNRLYRYALTLTAHEANAFDLLQDVMERYVKVNPDIDKPEHYIYRMIRNRYIDQLRQASLTPLESLDEIDIAISCDDEMTMERLIITDDLFKVIWNKLTGLERELLHFWAIEEMTAQEIAKRIDVPRGTVLSRIHRLRKRLESFDEIKQAYNTEVSI